MVDNKVISICRDHLGYLWIGTPDGLHKYDGTNIEIFVHDDEDSGSMPGDFIKFIFEDKSFNLWVGTNQGLVLYDRKRGKFKPMVFDLDDPYVNGITDTNSDLVFAYPSGLAFYNYKTKEVKLIELVDQIPMQTVFKLLTRNDDNIILISLNHLWNFNLKTNSLKEIVCGKSFSCETGMVDERGFIWIATKQDGILIFDHNGKEINDSVIQQFAGPDHAVVQDLVVKDGKVWISTDGDGIIIYDWLKQTFQRVQNQRGEHKSLPSNSITDIYVDHFGNVMTGSVRAGLIWIREVFIESFSVVAPKNPFGLSDPTVSALYEDFAGRIWIGTDGGGLNMFDPSTGLFEHIEDFKKDKIGSICSLGDSRLLVSSYREPIRFFNIKLKRYETGEQYKWFKEFSKLNYSIVFLKTDNKGDVWKLSDKSMLLRNNSELEYLNVKNGWDWKQTGTVNAFEPINDTLALIGGLQGVFRINTKQKTSEVVLNLWDEKWGHVLRVRNVNSMCKTGEVYWIASTLGLFCYNNKTKKVKRINSQLFRSIYAIAEGVDSSLWIGANNGLYRYFPKSNRFQHYGRSQGVKRLEFTNRAALKCKNGDVYLGTHNGLVKISGSKNVQLSDTTNSSSIFIDNILINGNPISESSNTSLKGNRLKMAWNHSSLRFNLVVNERAIFRNRIYRVLFEGYSTEIIETTDPDFYFPNIESGTYNLKVWYCRADGIWAKEYVELFITVPIPWWKQWWFVGGVISLIFGIYIIVLRNKTKQTALRLELINNKEIEKQEKLLNEKKMMFFTNISHEFRTPLSLIYGPLHRMYNDQLNRKGDNFDNIEIMYRAVRKIKRLVDEVLDFRKLDAGKQNVCLVEVPIADWLTDFLKQFELEFHAKELTLVTNFPNQGIALNCDIDKLDKILSNLISNAIKYSNDGESVFVTYDIEEDKIIFHVSDEGIGIKEEEKERIFERFFQAKGQRGGFGVGLSFTRNLVELLSGKIWVTNRVENGAQFSFFLPRHLLTAKRGKVERYIDPVELVEEDVAQKENDYGILQQKTILIVEDDNDLRKFIVSGLSQFCTVIEAANGNKAWGLIQSNVPDVIVSDIMMPELDGYQLCEKIKKDKRFNHLPVVLLTAKSDEGSYFSGYELGADSYLVKPFSLNMLCVVLCSIINNRDSQREIFMMNQSFINSEVNVTNMDVVFLKEVVDIIRENMENPDFDVNRLMVKFAMSRSTFYSKMKGITNLGVSEFIKQIRIETATEFILKSELSIGEIATKVGFVNQRYFSTVFKEFKSCTPTQFRNSSKPRSSS